MVTQMVTVRLLATAGTLSRTLLCSRDAVSWQTVCSNPNALSWEMQRKEFHYAIQ